MHPPQRFSADKSLQTLNAEGKLPKSEGSLVPQAPTAQPGQVFLDGVIGAIDDPQVLLASALDRRLGKATGPGG
jgi:hypothetical protein